MMTDKITTGHLQKTAFVYIRQSSMGQVRHHRESTERQYALQDTARSFGWHPHRIKVLDGDQGRSGASTTDREDSCCLTPCPHRAPTLWFQPCSLPAARRLGQGGVAEDD